MVKCNTTNQSLEGKTGFDQVAGAKYKVQSKEEPSAWIWHQEHKVTFENGAKVGHLRGYMLGDFIPPSSLLPSCTQYGWVSWTQVESSATGVEHRPCSGIIQILKTVPRNLWLFNHRHRTKRPVFCQVQHSICEDMSVLWALSKAVLDCIWSTYWAQWIFRSSAQTIFKIWREGKSSWIRWMNEKSAQKTVHRIEI